MEKSSLERVTIVISPEIKSKLRIIQANIMKKTGKSVSFSRIINIAATFGVRKSVTDFQQEFDKNEKS